jgi:hypothetical protein
VTAIRGSAGSRSTVGGTSAYGGSTLAALFGVRTQLHTRSISRRASRRTFVTATRPSSSTIDIRARWWRVVQVPVAVAVNVVDHDEGHVFRLAPE